MLETLPVPVAVQLPEEPERDVPWLVFAFDAGLFSFAPDPGNVPARAIVAAYVLLTDTRDSEESLTTRIARARTRYRARESGPRAAPRPSRAGHRVAPTSRR